MSAGFGENPARSMIARKVILPPIWAILRPGVFARDRSAILLAWRPSSRHVPLQFKSESA